MLRRRIALTFIALLAVGDAVAAANLWLLWQQRHGDGAALAAALTPAPADPGLSSPAPELPPR